MLAISRKYHRNRQHVAFTLGLSNHLYPAPEVVKAILRPEPGNKKRILDLGVYNCSFRNAPVLSFTTKVAVLALGEL
jgi:hypothetical protein